MLNSWQCYLADRYLQIPLMKKLLRRRSPTRLVNRDGISRIIRKGATYSYWRDPYHLLLILPWPEFLALLFLMYVATNTLFAVAYLAGGDCIANARPGNFFDVFFFSVQTMATIGYGSLYPRTFYANAVVSLEALAGLLGVAMATGLMFSRFSRPTAKVMFSRTAVITSYNGVPTLMFRTANQRHNQIVEAQIRLSLLRNEVTVEGHQMRRFYELPLVRNSSPIFMLSWTVMHVIDEASPLYGATPEMLTEMEAEIVVTLTGLDDTVSQTIHARHSYIPQEILWNMRFVDIFFRKQDGTSCIDYNLFHKVMPMPQVDLVLEDRA